MFKVLFIFIIFLQSSYAFLVAQNNYEEQALVLKSFDIGPRFLKDKKFISMKENVDRYETKHFLKVLENGNRFVPYLRQLISESGIPEAFLYMAMAESNFTPDAYSRARASGMWQFMPRTAKNFGLKINSYIDERRDPIKSTVAAIKYLKYLHKMFGKWYLAAMAYNCGEGRVKRAIREAKSDDINVLLSSKKRYIPKETKLYIRKIITMQSMANDPDFILENNSDYLLNQGSAETFSQVVVKQGTSLSSIASSIGMSVKKLKAFNPQLRYYFVPPQKGKYIVYIPYDKQISFRKNYRPSIANNRYYVYTVKRGDSLYKISRKYKIKYRIIKDFNHLKTTRLRLGQSLVIPVLKPVAIRYVIKKGDTIGRISRRFNVAINDIMRANHKKNSMIRVGEKIVIPQFN